MISFTKRNLKLFFRDKSAVFFSLLAVFIVIGLYALFLGDIWMQGMEGVDEARTLMNSWIMAGLLTVTSVTTTLGAFSVMVEDKAKKIAKDFYVSPIKRSSITAGYLLSSFVIGTIMSIVTLIIAEIYLIANGGDLLNLQAMLKIFGIILISSLANTATICFLVSFFKSNNAFTTTSTIIGTLIGFIAGVYLPIGSLPTVVQSVIKLFPISHSASLFRQVIMEAPINNSFTGIATQYVTEFKEHMGVVIRIGDYTVTSALSILILVATSLVFYTLAMLNMKRKNV